MASHAETWSQSSALAESTSLAVLPHALCIVEHDRYFTLLWASEAFYDVMGCTEEEVSVRFSRRIGALWSKEAVDQLAAFARGTARTTRFRHCLNVADDERILETEATRVPYGDTAVLCCVSRDCTNEVAAELELEQFRTLGACMASTAALEAFSYDAASRVARVMAPGPITRQLPTPGPLFKAFPETIMAAGLVHPEDVETFAHAFDSPMHEGSCYACDVRMGGPAPGTGRWSWYRLTLVGCANKFLPGGSSGGGVLMDITEHKELAMAYLNETQFYQAVLAERDAYAHVDVTENVILRIGGMWNLYNELIDSMSYTDIVCTFIDRVVHPDDREHYRDLMRCDNFITSLDNGIDQLGCEFRRIVEQNKMAWMQLSVHLLRDSATQHVLALVSIKNIDKKKRQELQLLVASERDPLTQALHKKAGEAAIRARMRNSVSYDMSALIILDIDDFKAINDQWGHKAGDSALVRFVHDVRCSIGKDDVLARFGGDEFVLFVANAFDEGYISKLVRDIYERLSHAVDPMFSCSAGIALIEAENVTYDQAFRQADAALYEAKAQGKATYCLYRDVKDGAAALTHSYVRRKRLRSSDLDGCEPPAHGVDALACVEGSTAGGKGVGVPSPTEAFSIENEPLSFVEEGDLLAFADFLSAQSEIAYLVDPDTFTLICGNKAFYQRIGETPTTCLGMKCYEAMQGRSTPCPFCSKANWTTDKFFMWRNDNEVLEQEFLIKSKLVNWQGREVLLAIAVDISNDKSIVDSLDSGSADSYRLLSGVQQMNAARDLDEVVECALETIGGFFRAERVRYWAREDKHAPYKCTVTWSREAEAMLPVVSDDRSLDSWLAAQTWDGPVMVESPESVLSSSFSMYRYMKENGIENERWIRLDDGSQDGRGPDYLSVENLGANLQNVAFLISFSVFMASELGKRRVMDSLLHASSHDDLTGLLNRDCYERRIESFDGERTSSVGVVSANVNGMKAINSSKGFATGNYYLRQFASMLLDVFPAETVYRLNGDEFAVIVTGVAREELERRMRELRAMVDTNGLFTVAAGYSWDDVEKNVDTLTEQAVRAMEADKRRFHDKNHDYAEDDDRRAMLSSLMESIRLGRFEVYLQPKVSLSTGTLVGAEALVRYRDPQLGIVPPARFIQTLEDNGFVRHVDLFVFEQVCQLLERWSRAGTTPPISLNLSRRTLLESDILASMESIAQRYVFNRDDLEVEITESFAAIGKGVLYQAANDLITAGYSLSLDDFGTKYTDLSILSDIKFNMIKLDKSLIDTLVDDRSKQVVLKHVVGMCNELRVDVIAEGVETTEQQEALTGLGCRLGQGYLYGRPVPIEEFECSFLRGGE